MATILMIDDTPLVVLGCRRFLQEQGYRVEMAVCGRLGLSMAQNLQPDLILLDLSMPDISGLDVLESLLRGENPHQPVVPVIVVSASDDADDIVQSLDLGAMVYISKPVDLQVLSARIRTVLRIKNSQEVLARTNQHLSLLASIDPLTQMYNRRRLFELSVRELAKAQRFSRDLAVIMLDMDHFKSFNDQHGHAMGDAILQFMGRILLATTRDTDIAGRIGGEEFAICCPETSLQGAVCLAERIRTELLLEPFQGHGVTIPVTASLGVSALSGEDKTFDSILDRADRMMYQAKHAGRNQVLSA